MDKARLQLEKQLQKHRALVDSFAKQFCFNPDDPHTYSYATALSKGERLERTLLIKEFGAITQEGYKLEL